jgi:hypothetical protein
MWSSVGSIIVVVLVGVSLGVDECVAPDRVVGIVQGCSCWQGRHPCAVGDTKKKRTSGTGQVVLGLGVAPACGR